MLSTSQPFFIHFQVSTEYLTFSLFQKKTKERKKRVFQNINKNLGDYSTFSHPPTLSIFTNLVKQEILSFPETKETFAYDKFFKSQIRVCKIIL